MKYSNFHKIGLTRSCNRVCCCWLQAPEASKEAAAPEAAEEPAAADGDAAAKPAEEAAAPEVATDKAVEGKETDAGAKVRGAQW